MLRSAKEMEGFAVRATDGVIGHVKDLYLDDEKWVIRYLIVETGSWLSSRKVLISPIAVGIPDWERELVPVSISKEQLRNSPDIATDKPVSRQHEMMYSGYFGYPYYWAGSSDWAGGMYPNKLMSDYGAFGGSLVLPPEDESNPVGESDDDPHLRSCEAVIGYHIHASDGDIGHVAGMLLDEETWAVRYLVVDTSNWWLGHQVLISPQWTEAVNWLGRTVDVAMTRQAVKNAPVYDPQADVSRDAEHRLYQHYGHEGYWTDHPVRSEEISRI